MLSVYCYSFLFELFYINKNAMCMKHLSNIKSVNNCAFSIMQKNIFGCHVSPFSVFSSHELQGAVPRLNI